MPPPTLAALRPVLLVQGSSHPALQSSRLVRCTIRQTSAAIAVCQVEVTDRPPAAPDVAGLPASSLALELSLGDAVTFKGAVHSIEAHGSSSGGSALVLDAKGRVAPATTAPAPLVFGQSLEQFTCVATLTPTRGVRARGVAGGLPPLRSGGTIELQGIGADWSGAYRLAVVEWTFDLERGARVSFEARRPASARPGPRRRT
jgi:hypothetical protein